MKNKKLFEKTVNILVKAYQNDTLIAGEPCACAVGNMISHNMGYDLIIKENSIKWPEGVNNAEWYSLICCNSICLSEEEIKQVNKDISSTGYSKNELIQIEKAFESWYNVSDDSEIFDKLMNTVDCLMEIHECDKYEANKAKALFVKETV